MPIRDEGILAGTPAECASPGPPAALAALALPDHRLSGGEACNRDAER